jgi:hypothetical protein
MDSVSITHYNVMTRWTIPVCLVAYATAVLPVFQACRGLRRQEHKRLTRPRYALLRCGSRTHTSPSQCRIPRIAMTSSSPTLFPTTRRQDGSMDSTRTVRADLVLTKFTLPVCEVLRSHEETTSGLGEAGWHLGSQCGQERGNEG